ncbi:MAG: 16S rRNA (cytidine(1402)-2'-O)-methyltransferase [SAR202 cluster bacterium]|nr:16S rRNA (cytidine(1402)-2'-O)-methyltransferase [SAR202 cluster bacterium]
MGRLYIVATPIGNLEDISVRAARVLREVKAVVCEDTRETRKLLNHLGASTPVHSYHAHSSQSDLERLARLLDDGDVAYVTDAGTPGISDPGMHLVGAATSAGHEVLSVPGPSAVASALAVSGFSGDTFTFLGFLPRKAGERLAALEEAAGLGHTLVAFEAPHRLLESLAAMRAALGDRRVAVCRELTKVYEETFRGTLSAAEKYFTEPRGEFVIVVEGATGAGRVSDERIAEVLARLRGTGLAGRRLVDAAREETGAPRSRVYRLAVSGPSTGSP